jgi:maltose alpha-D-glucosyltransferase/alpha-amylase
VLRGLRRQGGLDLEPSVSKAEQTNSSIIYGDRLILKFFRRLDFGINPDLEIGRFLSARKFPGSPPLAGALEYRSKDEPITVALLSSFVPGCKSAWEYTLDTLGRFYERIQTLPGPSSQAPGLPAIPVVQLAAMELPEEAEEMIGFFLQDARLLGERTALMHLTLASETDDPNFRPEPWTPHAQRGLFQSMRNLTQQNFQLLSQRLKGLPPEVQVQAQQVLDLEPSLLQRCRKVYEEPLDAVRIRTHGDYHLGQILHTGKDFLIIDFEGEPAIPLSERRLKRSPLQDVAGMVLSFHYAAQVALLKQSEHGSLQEGQMKAAAGWARYWSKWVGATFIKAYLKASSGAAYIPANEANLNVLLEALLLRSAVYEIGYELNNRPDWVKIPFQAILELMNQEGRT